MNDKKVLKNSPDPRLSINSPTFQLNKSSLNQFLKNRKNKLNGC